MRSMKPAPTYASLCKDLRFILQHGTAGDESAIGGAITGLRSRIEGARPRKILQGRAIASSAYPAFRGKI